VTTTVILLAAGRSRRTSGLKQLYRVHGEYLINLQIRTLQSYGFNVAAVLGYEAERIQKVLNKDVTVIWNEKYEEGMFSSVKKALSTLNGDTFLFCHVDRPVPEHAVFKALLKSKKAVAVAFYEGEKAPPVLIHASAKNRLIRSDLKRLDAWVVSEEEVDYIEVDDPKIHWNANTDESLKRYFG